MPGQRLQALKKCKSLKDKAEFSSIFISPDRTYYEQVERRKFVNELSKKRIEDPSKTFAIRKYVIVCLSTES